MPKPRKTGEKTPQRRMERRDDEDRKNPVYKGKRPANRVNTRKGK